MNPFTKYEALVLTRAMAGVFLPEDEQARPEIIRKLHRLELDESIAEGLTDISWEADRG